jgi:peptide/nickel transport system substrate-binding protein
MHTNRRNFLKLTAAAGGAAMTPFAWATRADAQGLETMVVASGQTINSLDLHRTGTNRASYQVAINCYDRLVGFGSRQLPTGEMSYDYDTIVPELAESWTISEDGLVFTFTLKPDATFTDGTPVTAADVKWSFDRAVSVGGFPSTQMRAGGFFRPDQFEAVDDRTFVVRLDYPSKLSLPEPGRAGALHHQLHRRTGQRDRGRPLGDGIPAHHARRIRRLQAWCVGTRASSSSMSATMPGSAGRLPAIQRVIMREVPSPATRRALIERGDVQISFDIPDKDASELAARWMSSRRQSRTASIAPVLNTRFEPFQDPDVRKAIAYAIPYEAIFQIRRLRARRADVGRSDQIARYRLAAPFALCDRHGKGPRTSRGLQLRRTASRCRCRSASDLADWMEPTALLIQEASARSASPPPIEKIPAPTGAPPRWSRSACRCTWRTSAAG